MNRFYVYWHEGELNYMNDVLKEMQLNISNCGGLIKQRFLKALKIKNCNISQQVDYTF